MEKQLIRQREPIRYFFRFLFEYFGGRKQIEPRRNGINWILTVLSQTIVKLAATLAIGFLDWRYQQCLAICPLRGIVLNKPFVFKKAAPFEFTRARRL